MSLVDHLVQQMQERLLPQEHRFLKQYLVPKKLHACIHKREVSDKVYGTYKTDLSEKREYDTEILRWKTKWQHSPPGKSPATLAETLERANPVLYPNVSAVLSILLTMPVSTATPERSFSSMRRIKTYLLATMKTERLSSFALMQMCREMHDHRRGGCGPWFLRQKELHRNPHNSTELGFLSKKYCQDTLTFFKMYQWFQS